MQNDWLAADIMMASGRRPSTGSGIPRFPSPRPPWAVVVRTVRWRLGLVRATGLAVMLFGAGCGMGAGQTRHVAGSLRPAEAGALDSNNKAGQMGIETEIATVRVRMDTELGPMIFEIYTDKAPVTARNFLRLVDEARYSGASFYRTVRRDNQPNDKVKIEVIQGGMGIKESAALPPIEHEATRKTGIRHLDGTLSMARMEVGSATTEFFICIGAQPDLDQGGSRNTDGQGFAAFGRLISGNEVPRRIHQRPDVGQVLAHPVKVFSITRLDRRAATSD